MKLDDNLFEQLAVVKQRLETFPFAHHEATCLRDCLLTVIRTIAGEQVERHEVDKIGSGPPAVGGNRGRQDILIGGRIMDEGVEVHPGVVMYSPQAQHHVMQDGAPNSPGQAALIDVNEAMAPKAVAGSLMAGVQDGGGNIEEFRATPEGIPKPEDTKVEIIKSPVTDPSQLPQAASGNHSAKHQETTGK